MPRRLGWYFWIPRTLRTAVPAAAMVFLFGAQCGAPPLGSGIRKDEFECEEAVQHAENCCGQKLMIKCTYYASCEGGYRSYPAIPPDSAFMLRTTSCEDLVASGFCADPQGNLEATGRDAGGGSIDMSTKPDGDLDADLGADLR